VEINGLRLGPGANLANADLSGCQLGSTKTTPAVSLSEANLMKANLSSARCHKVNFAGVDLEKANFGDADLNGIVTSEVE